MRKTHYKYLIITLKQHELFKHETIIIVNMMTKMLKLYVVISVMLQKMFAITIYMKLEQINLQTLQM
jgi:hypothetical protein